MKITAPLTHTLHRLPRRTLIASGSFMLALLVILPTAAFSYGKVASVEPESGTLSGGATVVVSDAAASGGSAIQFTTAIAGAKPACAPFPSFPDETCTGTYGDLPDWTPAPGSSDTVSDNTINIYTDNEVIENVTMRANMVYVAAQNVTFRNVKFIYTGTLDETYALIDIHQPATFEYCDIDGAGLVARGIFNSAATIRNTAIHDTGNAYEASTPATDGDVSITDSYIYNITNPVGDDWHDDGIQVDPSDGVDITVVHNTVLVPDANTSAMSIQDTQTVGGVRQKANSTVLIKNNLIGGGGYTMSTGFATNYQIVDNYFTNRYHPKVGLYNIWFYDAGADGDVVRSGNIIPETGVSADNNL